LMRQRGCVTPMERDIVGLNSARNFLRRWSGYLRIDKVFSVDLEHCDKN